MISDAFIDVSLLQYQKEYGEKECNEIAKSCVNSRLFTKNIGIALDNDDVPTGKDINAIINSSGFKFIFYGNRKIYFASLYFLKILYSEYQRVGKPINMLNFMQSFNEVCETFQRTR